MKYIIIYNPNINIVHLFIAIILIGINACKKDKPTICSSENTLYIPSDAVKRFYFKDSSYWIYQDSASGLIDSLWVSDSKIVIGNLEKINPSSSGKCFESFSISLNSKFIDKYEIYVGGVSSALETPYEKEIFEIRYIKKGYFLDEFNLKNNQYELLDSEYGKVYFLNAANLNNVTYDNVLVNINYNALGNYIYLEAYYVKHKGLVKYKLKDGSVWNIKKMNIKQ